MIQPYLVFHIKGYIFGFWEDAQHGFQKKILKKNEQSLDVLKECGVQILFEVLYVKKFHL